MRFIFIPLLIVGMFLSFSAAFVAMLFFTQTLKSPDELRDLIMGRKDLATRIMEEVRGGRDPLVILTTLGEEYSAQYRQQLAHTEQLRDSLETAIAQVKMREAALLARERELQLLSDSTLVQQMLENHKTLIHMFSKMKPAAAAEILQHKEELNLTAVAQLMKDLPPTQTAKIMAYMEPDRAAQITKTMQML